MVDPFPEIPLLSLLLVDGLLVRMALSLSLVNGGASRTLRLKILRVQGKGGRTDPGTGPSRPAWADWPRPIPVRLGRPFTPMGEDHVWFEDRWMVASLCDE
jgi:hypothetical protein